MKFYATARFQSSIKKLERKKKEYGCIRSSIYDELYDKTDEELEVSGYFLMKPHPIIHFTKIRVQACGANAKSSGFRVIAFINKKNKSFTFLDVYPKYGKFNKSNMKKEERAECLEEMKQELKTGTLLGITFDKKTKKIIIK